MKHNKNNKFSSLRPYWSTSNSARNDETPHRTLSKIKEGLCKQKIEVTDYLGGAVFNDGGFLLLQASVVTIQIGLLERKDVADWEGELIKYIDEFGQKHQSDIYEITYNIPVSFFIIYLFYLHFIFPFSIFHEINLSSFL